MTIGRGINIALGRLSRLQGAVAGVAVSFTWHGAEVECVANSYEKGTVLVEGGFEVQASVKIYVEKRRFLTVDSTLVSIDSELYSMDSNMPTPVAGKRLLLGSRKLRVERTHDPLPGDATGFWVLYCNDVSK
jgi:hypothetical protein